MAVLNIKTEQQAHHNGNSPALHTLPGRAVGDILRRAGVLDDLAAVEALLYEGSQSASALITAAGRHTIAAGGKRLRATLVLLAAHLRDYCFERASHAAVAVELLHAASLIHDDLVDHAQQRRGHVTVHAQWDKDVALMLGDYLFARAAYELAEEPDSRILRYYVDAAQTMVEGELSPVTKLQPIDQALAQYRHKIWAKTAVLFEAACKCGIAGASGSEDDIIALASYGRELGMAFQIVDDVLDIVGDEQLLGKPAGNDLREGTLTLPLIYAVHMSADPLLRDLAQRPHPRLQDVPAIIEAIIHAEGHTRAMADAHEHIKRAVSSLSSFSESPARTALIELGDFILQRQQ